MTDDHRDCQHRHGAHGECPAIPTYTVNPHDCEHGRWNPDKGQCLDCGRALRDCPICLGSGRYFSEEAGPYEGEMVSCVTCRGSGRIDVPPSDTRPLPAREADRA